MLASSPRRGFALAAYLVPAAVLALAVVAVLLTARRRRGVTPLSEDVLLQDQFEALVDVTATGAMPSGHASATRHSHARCSAAWTASRSSDPAASVAIR